MQYAGYKYFCHLFDLTKDEKKRVQEEKAEKAAIKCAQAMNERCSGKP